MMNSEAILQLDNDMYEQIKLILDYYGWDRQQKKACEALAELQAEISHHEPWDVLEGKDVYRSITSKVADVCILLEQIVKMYSIKKSDINEEMVDKLRCAQDKIMEESRRSRIRGLGIQWHAESDALKGKET